MPVLDFLTIVGINKVPPLKGPDRRSTEKSSSYTPYVTPPFSSVLGGCCTGAEQAVSSIIRTMLVHKKEQSPQALLSSTYWNLSNCSTNRNYQIRIYLSVSINTALHGEPSAPSKFSGAAFKKYIPSDTSAKRIPSSKTTSADNSARWTAIGALCGPIV